VAHATLLLRHAGQRKVCCGTCHDHVDTGRRPLGRRTSREVSVGIQVKFQFRKGVSNPAIQAKMLGRMNITHQTVELTITIPVPFRDFCSQCAHSSEKIEPSHTCGIQNLHEDLGGAPVQALGRCIPCVARSDIS
jgi:hypothetical protein